MRVVNAVVGSMCPIGMPERLFCLREGCCRRPDKLERDNNLGLGRSGHTVVGVVKPDRDSAHRSGWYVYVGHIMDYLAFDEC